MYFLDTYVLIEYLGGNSKCKQYINSNFCVSRFNLMELYYVSVRDSGETQAEKDYEIFAPAEIEISEKTLKNAMKKRFELKKTKLDISYVDAIGYQYSLEHNLKFVTGDPAFEKLEGVEYIREK